MCNFLSLLLCLCFTNILNNPVQNFKTIGANLEASDKHTHLTSLMKSTTLLEMLKSKGSYTLFAPNDNALNRNKIYVNKNDKEVLKDILNYHIVLGKYEANYLIKMIKHRQNRFILTSISGKNLYLSLDHSDNILLHDENKNQTLITPFPESSSNGIVYETELLLMPGGS